MVVHWRVEVADLSISTARDEQNIFIMYTHSKLTAGWDFKAFFNFEGRKKILPNNYCSSIVSWELALRSFVFPPKIEWQRKLFGWLKAIFCNQKITHTIPRLIRIWPSQKTTMDPLPILVLFKVVENTGKILKPTSAILRPFGPDFLVGIYLNHSDGGPGGGHWTHLSWGYARVSALYLNTGGDPPIPPMTSLYTCLIFVCGCTSIRASTHPSLTSLHFFKNLLDRCKWHCGWGEHD